MRTGPGDLVSSRKLKLTKLFQSSSISLTKKLKVFQKMEKVFAESELGAECLKLADDLIKARRPAEEVLSFAKRALHIFLDNDSKGIPCFGKTYSRVTTSIRDASGTTCTSYHKSSFYIANVCNALGAACFALSRFNECLSYLKWANRNLCKLREDGDDGSCSGNCLLNVLVANYGMIYELKFKTGKFDEAVICLRKKLEIQESVVEEGCIQLGDANEELFEAYKFVRNYEEALPFGLKALEVYTKHLGGNSVKVMDMMMRLAVIYRELGEYAKALEYYQLSRTIMTPDSPRLLEAELIRGDILNGLGRYGEAIDVLKCVVSDAKTDGAIRGFAFGYLAKAFCYLKKFPDAKKYMRKAQRIFEKKEEHLMNVVNGFRDLSMLYEKMDDFENAISLLRRSLSIPEIPHKLLAEGSARLFSLISLSGKAEEGIAYMENVVEILKEKFGAEHCEVGHGYRNLGATYLKSGQEQLAVKFMVKGKEIMDVTLGPHHLDSLKTSLTLAETYATIGRYDPAIEILENVVGGLKVSEPRDQKFMDTAIKLLDNMKERVAESPTRASPQSKDDEDLSAKILKCSISEDGRVLE